MLSRLWDLVDGPSTDWRMRRRVTVTAVAVLVLLWRARSGTTTSELVLLAALFLLTAGVWLHAQYVDDLDGRSWSLHPAVAAALLVLAGLAGLVGAWADITFVLPASVVVAYFGIASLMTWARDQTGSPGTTAYATQGWHRAAALAAGLVLAVVGLLLVGHTGLVALGAALAAGGLALVVMPAFVLLAEWLIRRWTAHPSRWAALAAAAVLVLTVAAAWLWVSGTVVVVVCLIAGLAFAAVLGTHVDFVGVMLVAALLGVTPQPVQAPRDLVLTSSRSASVGGPLHGRVLVSLGDSYMSGEGASVFYDGTDTGKDQCRQAPTAWSRELSRLGRFDSMLFLACSGALTQNLLHAGPTPPASDRLPAPPPPEAQAGTVKTQLDAAATALQGRTPDLVVVSVGGNDAGFSGIGAMCLAPGHCDDEHALWDSQGNFAQLQNQLDQVYTEIAAQFPSSAVVITPYPDPIDTDRDADCGDLLLTRSEVRFVHDFLLGNGDEVGLDGTIELTARAHGFYYAAPMVTALHDEHLQLCDPTHGSPGIHFIGLRSINGVAEQRFDPKNWLHSSLHPNERGHAALLHAFSGWYQQQLGAQIKAGTAVRSGDGYRLATRTAGEPLLRLPYASVGCLIADDRHGCRAKASAWVRRESVDLLLTTWAGPVLGLAALAGGVLAAAFTAWRRRRWAGAYVPFP